MTIKRESLEEAWKGHPCCLRRRIRPVRAADEDAEAFAQEAAQAAAAAALGDETPTADEEALGQVSEELTVRGDSVEGEVPADIAVLDEDARESLDKLAARSKRLSPEQTRHVLHALLFVSEKPLTVDQLRAPRASSRADHRRAGEACGRAARGRLAAWCSRRWPGAAHMRTAPESGGFRAALPPREAAPPHPRSARDPRDRRVPPAVTRPGVEDIRGVDCGAVVKALLDWKLIKDPQEGRSRAAAALRNHPRVSRSSSSSRIWRRSPRFVSSRSSRGEPCRSSRKRLGPEAARASGARSPSSPIRRSLEAEAERTPRAKRRSPTWNERSPRPKRSRGCGQDNQPAEGAGSASRDGRRATT